MTTYHFDPDTDGESWDAAAELARGNVLPAVTLLRDHEQQCHPMLRDEIAALLDGTHRSFRVELVRLKRGAPTKQKAASDARDRAIAHFVNAQPGRRKPAEYDAAKAFRTSVREVQRAMKRVKDGEDRLRRFCTAHKVRQ